MSSPPTTSQKKSTFRSRVGTAMRRSSTAFSIPGLPNRSGSATPPPPQESETAPISGKLDREGSVTSLHRIITAPVVAAASSPSPIPESPAREAVALAAEPAPRGPSPLTNVTTAETTSEQSPTTLRARTPSPLELAPTTSAPQPTISADEQLTQTVSAVVVKKAESPRPEAALLPVFTAETEESSPLPRDSDTASDSAEPIWDSLNRIDTPPVAAAASTIPSPIAESPAREAAASAAEPKGHSPLTNVIMAEAALDQSPTPLRSGTPPPPEPAAATVAPRSISPDEQPTKTTPVGVVNEAESPRREVALLPTDEPEEMPTTQAAPPTRLDGDPDEPPSELSWLRDVLKSSAVAPLGGIHETSDPLGASFLKNVLPTSDAPLPVHEIPKKRFVKFRDIFTRKRKDGEAEIQVQKPLKRPFKLHTILPRKKKDETQPQPGHQQGVGGAEADTDETTPQELTAKDKGKQRESDPNPAPAGHISHASTRSTTHQPTTSASQTKHRVRDGVAGIMRRRNGSTAQAQNRLESTPLAEGNSTERDAAKPSRVRKDSSNRRPWFRRTRDPEVVEVMEGHMPDRYVSGHKFANKKRSSSVGSGSGSEDTEDRAEDNGEDEHEQEPTRNKTPSGLIGMFSRYWHVSSSESGLSP
ncbi:hypothetical protein PAXINDRAFT_16967 [Paxillus involutus ATCC 200175]|uniref:Uncharacterized protein n=1 Tax=Paxillus involutus ATCC 200175 TaxID=664439 RepID=A0A0C9TS12_PAXIN|nr:hypothetical protein PAXINDRAFT_16967 [Paxillus involutus ATCC 200175]